MPTTLDLTGLRFAAPAFLTLLWIPAALLVLWVWQAWRRRGDVKRMRRQRQLPNQQRTERLPLLGDLAYWFAAPYNVHRQWAGPDGCIELVLHGGSGRRQRHFDLERGTWEDAPTRGAEADTQGS